MPAAFDALQTSLTRPPAVSSGNLRDVENPQVHSVLKEAKTRVFSSGDTSELSRGIPYNRLQSLPQLLVDTSLSEWST